MLNVPFQARTFGVLDIKSSIFGGKILNEVPFQAKSYGTDSKINFSNLNVMVKKIMAELEEDTDYQLLKRIKPFEDAKKLSLNQLQSVCGLVIVNGCPVKSVDLFFKLCRKAVTMDFKEFLLRESQSDQVNRIKLGLFNSYERARVSSSPKFDLVLGMFRCKWIKLGLLEDQNGTVNK